MAPKRDFDDDSTDPKAIPVETDDEEVSTPGTSEAFQP